jgi:hypothetical protein
LDGWGLCIAASCQPKSCKSGFASFSRCARERFSAAGSHTTLSNVSRARAGYGSLLSKTQSRSRGISQ